MKVKKMSKSEISRKVHEVADKIKITEEQLQKNVSELSGGQQQRVALARGDRFGTKDPLSGRAVIQPGCQAQNRHAA